jgi:cellulose synthase/poly-beta-1,6-N-acetylglucosamine synthase-like glycosyltransferase
MNINQLGVLLIDYFLLAIVLLISLPIFILTIECFSALLPIKPRLNNHQKLLYRPSIAILIPAHNEELGISKTLETIVPQLNNRDRVIVIADNCTDGTAAIARSFDVHVIERNNLQHRGKGYALDCGIRYLQKQPPQVVIIVDADCYVHSGAIDRLARLAYANQKPVQPVNLLKRQAKSNPKSSISELAFMVKNLVRPIGLSNLGLPCLITMGTAFPWSIIHQAPLASSNLVEDMQLGIDLALSGTPPIFCRDAKVTGVLPQRENAATSQRTRWEHGHLSTLQIRVPQLLKASVIQKRLDLLAIALDLSIPPLSLLVIIWGAIVTLGLFIGVLGGGWSLSQLSLIEGILLLLSIVGTWAKFGRKDIPLQSLLILPGYIFWKIQIYRKFLVKREQNWVRTERNIVDDLILQNVRN